MEQSDKQPEKLQMVGNVLLQIANLGVHNLLVCLKIPTNTFGPLTCSLVSYSGDSHWVPAHHHLWLVLAIVVESRFYELLCWVNSSRQIPVSPTPQDSA
jgi:hypothetical protein